MYYFISAMIGSIIAVMVAFNGGLSAKYGVFGAAVIIHLTGAIILFAALKILKVKFKSFRSIPLWTFLGGTIGVMTTTCNNFAFGKISMTSLIALGLFGQTIISICIDRFGWIGMPRHKFNRIKLIGLMFAASGILIMMKDLKDAALAAVCLSMMGGVSVVLSRTVNARLAMQTGSLQTTFINHSSGLLVTTVILFLFGREEPIFTSFSLSPHIWIYFGGTMGAVTVLLLNLTVPKIQAVYLSFLSFVGQVFTGIVIDIFTGQKYSSMTFYGGILVACGLFMNFFLDYLFQKKLKF